MGIFSCLFRFMRTSFSIFEYFSFVFFLVHFYFRFFSFSFSYRLRLLPFLLVSRLRLIFHVLNFPVPFHLIRIDSVSICLQCRRFVARYFHLVTFLSYFFLSFTAAVEIWSFLLFSEHKNYFSREISHFHRRSSKWAVVYGSCNSITNWNQVRLSNTFVLVCCQRRRIENDHDSYVVTDVRFNLFTASTFRFCSMLFFPAPFRSSYECVCARCEFIDSKNIANGRQLENQRKS